MENPPEFVRLAVRRWIAYGRFWESQLSRSRLEGRRKVDNFP